MTRAEQQQFYADTAAALSQGDRIAQLEAALRPLADIPFEEFLDHRPDHLLMAWNRHKLTVADVLAARTALAKAGASQ